MFNLISEGGGLNECNKLLGGISQRNSKYGNRQRLVWPAFWQNFYARNGNGPMVAGKEGGHEE
jgi:hypothetical protein